MSSFLGFTGHMRGWILRKKITIFISHPELTRYLQMMLISLASPTTVTVTLVRLTNGGSHDMKWHSPDGGEHEHEAQCEGEQQLSGWPGLMVTGGLPRGHTAQGLPLAITGAGDPGAQGVAEEGDGGRHEGPQQLAEEHHGENTKSDRLVIAERNTVRKAVCCLLWVQYRNN